MSQQAKLHKFPVKLIYGDTNRSSWKSLCPKNNSLGVMKKNVIQVVMGDSLQMSWTCTILKSGWKSLNSLVYISIIIIVEINK